MTGSNRDGGMSPDEVLTSFILRHHHKYHRPIALVTSGGTVCDLEVNSVRYLDNFSTGRRGATSVEQFIKRGYAVIHLWRRGSASPYARVVADKIGLASPQHGLDVDSLGRLLLCPVHGTMGWCTCSTMIDGAAAGMEEDVLFDESHGKHIRDRLVHEYTGDAAPVALSPRLAADYQIRVAMRERSDSLHNGMLLTIPFRTVEDYLYQLERVSVALQPVGRMALVYLAAAVSDFYIPEGEKSVHKIQSREVASVAKGEDPNSDGCLVLRLKPVPKLIPKLRTEWSPEAFVVSFKLETDVGILERKARNAVSNYGVHLVVANVLHSRHDKVWMVKGVSSDVEHDANEGQEVHGGGDMVEISRDHNEIELEDVIVEFVAEKHFEHIALAGPQGAGATMMMDSSARGAQREAIRGRQREIRNRLWWTRARDLILNVGGSILGMYISYWISSALKRRLHGPR